jgi:hypothetical protein
MTLVPDEVNQVTDSPDLGSAFSDAFAEAVNPESPSGGTGDNAGKGSEVSVQPAVQPADKGSGESNEKPEIDGEPPVETKPDDIITPDPPTPSTPDPRLTQLESERNLLAQQYSTLQGMFKAEKGNWEKEKEALKTDLLTRKSSDIMEGILESMSEEDRKLVEEYDSEFDTVSKAESLKRKALLAGIERKFEQKFDLFKGALAEIITTLQTKEDATHFSSLRTAHPDYESLRDSGKILGWIESQPKYLRGGLTAAYQNGAADDVIDLITRFKKETGLATRTTPKTTATQNAGNVGGNSGGNGNGDDTARRLQNLTVVADSRKPVHSESAARAESFTDAFKEAANAAGIGRRN